MTTYLLIWTMLFRYELCLGLYFPCFFHVKAVLFRQLNASEKSHFKPASPVTADGGVRAYLNKLNLDVCLVSYFSLNV